MIKWVKIKNDATDNVSCWVGFYHGDVIGQIKTRNVNGFKMYNYRHLSCGIWVGSYTKKYSIEFAEKCLRAELSKYFLIK